MFQFDLGKTELMARSRLEQRFIRQENDVRFTQRARLFFSAQIPLIANKLFTCGLFLGIQNEIFFNIQRKEAANNRFFDQNRTFVSAGYRWSKQIDTDLGFMLWLDQDPDDLIRNNVLQLTITMNL